MNKCSISKHCTEAVHNNIEECMNTRNKYYGFQYKKEYFGLICKKCKTITWGIESSSYFYMIHGSHLGRLSESKKNK